MYGLIYCATNIINGNKYVGQTIYSLKARIRSHKHAALGKVDKTYFHKALKKYSMDNFMWTILCHVDNKKALEKAEIYWIEYHDTIKTGYNLKKGSAHGEYSYEAKAKMSKAHKGRSLSEETKRKLSIINSGKTLSEEHKIKIGMANKGKKASKKTIEKLRQAQLGKVAWNKGLKGIHFSVRTEFKKGQVSLMKGKHHTAEAKEKNRQAHLGKSGTFKGKHHTTEAKEKNRLAHLGQIPWCKGLKLGPQSEEHRNKIGVARKGHIVTEETRQKIRLPQLGRTFTEEHKRKIKEARKNQIFTEETRLKLSLAAKKQWADPEIKIKMSKAIKNGKRWNN